jgi:hypothetical protein
MEAVAEAETDVLAAVEVVVLPPVQDGGCFLQFPPKQSQPPVRLEKMKLHAQKVRKNWMRFSPDAAEDGSKSFQAKGTHERQQG